MDMGTLSSRGNVGANAPASATHYIKEVTTTRADIAVQAEELKDKGRTEPDREQVLATVEEMQEFLQAAQHDIQFQLDDDSGRMLVKVTERGTGEVIRQIRRKRQSGWEICQDSRFAV